MEMLVEGFAAQLMKETEASFLSAQHP